METFLLISKYNVLELLSICTADFDHRCNECVITAAFFGSLALRRVQRLNVGGKGALQGALPSPSSGIFDAAKWLFPVPRCFSSNERLSLELRPETHNDFLSS